MDNPTPQNPLSQPVQPALNTPQAQPVQASQGPSQDAQTLLGNFMAIDPTRSGVGMDKIRAFYPKVGWRKILAAADELERAGLLTKRAALNDRGGVSYHVYTWKEA